MEKNEDIQCSVLWDIVAVYMDERIAAILWDYVNDRKIFKCLFEQNNLLFFSGFLICDVNFKGI